MADNDHNNNSDSQPLTYELAIQPTFFEFDDNNRETKLKQYNLLLQNIEIEKRLGKYPDIDDLYIQILLMIYISRIESPRNSITSSEHLSFAL